MAQEGSLELPGRVVAKIHKSHRVRPGRTFSCLSSAFAR